MNEYIFILYNSKRLLVWQLVLSTDDPVGTADWLIDAYNKQNSWHPEDTDSYAYSCKYIDINVWMRTLRNRGLDYIK